MSLRNKAILITRPQPAADELAAQLQALGATTWVQPTLIIASPTSLASLQQAARTLHHYDMALFISPNSVSMSMPSLRSTWPSSLRVAAVGSGTAATLAELGLHDILVPAQEFNSEGLLALPALQNISGKKIALFKGEGGRELLAETLRERGALVDEIICYQRRLPPPFSPHLIQAWQKSLSAIVVTSQEGLQNLVTLLSSESQPWLYSQQLLVISKKMLECANALGFTKPPLVAANATNTAIVAALMSGLNEE